MKTKRGFTLLELLIVIIISSALTVIVANTATKLSDSRRRIDLAFNLGVAWDYVGDTITSSRYLTPYDIEHNITKRLDVLKYEGNLHSKYIKYKPDILSTITIKSYVNVIDATDSDSVDIKDEIVSGLNALGLSNKMYIIITKDSVHVYFIEEWLYTSSVKLYKEMKY